MEYASFMLKIRPEDYEEYRRRHERVDPELEEQFRLVGIRAYHIYFHEGLLFAHMVADNFSEAMDRLAEHPANVKWQQYMSDMLLLWEENGATVKELQPVYRFVP
ncbi:L-rhamnose mutarotase [Paenibacillus koleovorans]|uniref:L-rhamnose mutarotase n=1 Tax=Paenibacillus koleovorans TaxID=121608 RepID=UPI0013E29980|nr:L-rhamnose mutarotase [Paenibacillus koleovorans]